MSQVALDDIAKELGARLREARVRANLTQDELAAELGFSPRSLQDYEAGKALPHPRRRRRIAAFLAAYENGRAA